MDKITDVFALVASLISGNTIGNVFDLITSFEFLLAAERHARKGRRTRKDIIAFESDLDANILRLQEKLRNGSFHFGPYRRRWIYFPKRRRIVIVPYESRVVHWAIYMVLNPFFDRRMIEDSYACRVGKKGARNKHHKVAIPGTRMPKGALAAVRRLQYWLAEDENGVVVELDIEKFFYHISHDILKEITGRYIKDRRFLDLVVQAIENEGECFGLPRHEHPDFYPENLWINTEGEPIGNLPSQLFANVYLNELDQYCKHILKIHKYSRYMDDIRFIAPDIETARGWIENIRTFLWENLRLDLNGKTKIVRSGRVQFVGYIVKPNYIRLKRNTIVRIGRAFQGICKSGMDDYAFARRVASYEGLIRPASSDGLRGRLNKIYLTERRNTA